MTEPLLCADCGREIASGLGTSGGVPGGYWTADLPLCEECSTFRFGESNRCLNVLDRLTDGQGVELTAALASEEILLSTFVQLRRSAEKMRAPLQARIDQLEAELRDIRRPPTEPEAG